MFNTCLSQRPRESKSKTPQQTRNRRNRVRSAPFHAGDVLSSHSIVLSFYRHASLYAWSNSHSERTDMAEHLAARTSSLPRPVSTFLTRGIRKSGYDGLYDSVANNKRTLLGALAQAQVVRQREKRGTERPFCECSKGRERDGLYLAAELKLISVWSGFWIGIGIGLNRPFLVCRPARTYANSNPATLWPRVKTPIKA